MSRLKKLTLAAAATAAAPALAEPCPPPLDTALRLVMITTPDMNSSTARLELFERRTKDAPWTRSRTGAPVMLGTNGLAWGYTFRTYKRAGEAEKREGDMRTPAGFFPLGPSFGFTARKLHGHIRIEKGKTVCVEDPASPHYNTITTRAAIGTNIKADNMGDTRLFRNGLFVAYPSDRATRAGSCIFLHIWKSPSTSTHGCVAMPETRIKFLQEFAEDGAVLGVLPQGARQRFEGCPLLPDE